jgi:rubredoxin
VTRLGRWLAPGVAFDESRATWTCRNCGYAWVPPPLDPAGAGAAPPTRAPDAHRCSECGVEVDPVTRRGLRWSIPGMFTQWLMRGPGLPTLGAGLVAAAMLAYARSAPVGYFRFELLAAALLAFAAIALALSAVAAAVLAARLGRLGDAARQRGWWFVPVAWAAAVAIALSPLPLEAGFRARRADLVRLAGLWESGDLERLREARAPGPYGAAGGAGVLFDGDRPVAPLDICGGALRAAVPAADEAKWRGLVIAVDGTGFMFERGGYVYLPDLPEQDMPAGTLDPLGDGWWQGMVEMH